MNPSEYQAIGDPQRWREQPLPVTGLFLCYQQARFVGEALDGALSQTVPMQLIVSDDGSSDGTAEVLVDRLRDYRGPHQVLLRVGHPNLGLVPHLNRLMERAEGELIVLFAGDDISYPNRVARLAEEYHTDSTVQVVGSLYTPIHADGSPHPEPTPPCPDCAFGLIDYLGMKNFVWMAGATMSFRTRLAVIFGALPETLWAEDNIIVLRGLLLGKDRILKDKLIRYRVVNWSLGRNQLRYGEDLASVIATHSLGYRRLRGHADTLAKDIVLAGSWSGIDANALRVLQRRHEEVWRGGEELHRAVALFPRRNWIVPALKAVYSRAWRRPGLRVLLIALWPALFFWLKAVRHRGERVRPAPEIEPR